jgi:hypothetical protein
LKTAGECVPAPQVVRYGPHSPLNRQKSDGATLCSCCIGLSRVCCPMSSCCFTDCHVYCCVPLQCHERSWRSPSLVRSACSCYSVTLRLSGLSVRVSRAGHLPLSSAPVALQLYMASMVQLRQSAKPCTRKAAETSTGTQVTSWQPTRWPQQRSLHTGGHRWWAHVWFCMYKPPAAVGACSTPGRPVGCAHGAGDGRALLVSMLCMPVWASMLRLLACGVAPQRTRVNCLGYAAFAFDKWGSIRGALPY